VEESSTHLSSKFFGNIWREILESLGWLWAFGDTAEQDEHDDHGGGRDGKAIAYNKQLRLESENVHSLDTENPSPVDLEQNATKDWTNCVSNRIHEDHESALDIIIVQ
jgi:hypothetical protein